MGCTNLDCFMGGRRSLLSPLPRHKQLLCRSFFGDAVEEIVSHLVFSLLWAAMQHLLLA